MKPIKLSSSYLLTIIIISLAISPAIALGEDQRNLFLIGIMSISPILFISYRKYYQSDIWLILFMISIILSPLLNHPDSMRWSTVMYTLMFGFTFLAYKNMLHVSTFTITDYQKLLKYLIYAYAIVLLIQQFCVLAGLPIFNVSNYHPEEPWKLNSLTSEPSHSARIMGLLMYSYITAKELVLERKYNFHLDFKSDKWIWFSFLWTMITMGSGTAFLFITVVLLKFIRFKNLIPLFIVFALIILVVDMMGITAFERTYKLFMATLTLDTTAIFEADGSGSYRIIPMIILAQMIDLTSLNGWFGHGVDYVASILSFYVPGLPEGWTGGGMFQIWMDFGFLSFALFMIFTFSNTLKKGDYLGYIFWFMLIFMQGINNQIVWLCIVLLFTNKYFEKHVSKSKTSLKKENNARQY